MSDPKKVGLPYPFRYCEDDPFYLVEIGPKEFVAVVPRAGYEAVVRHLEDQLEAQKAELDNLRGEYFNLMAEHLALREAAMEQMQSAQHLIQVWSRRGHEGT